MAREDQAPAADDANPCNAPAPGPAGCDRKRKNAGCLILFLLALPLLDAFSIVLASTWPYHQVVLVLSVAGFMFGAALGAYVSVTIKKEEWCSSCRWAIYGLLGMCLPAFVFAAILAK
jgi:hypothetical protein